MDKSDVQKALLLAGLSFEMDIWDIQEQDEFESRNADELEMLDGLEEEGESIFAQSSFYLFSHK